MNSSSDILLKLIRIALGNETVFSLPYSIDWQKVIDLSFEQGVAAIAIDGLQRLYDLQPELELAIDSPELEGLKYEWFGEVMSSESAYSGYKSAIAGFLRLCKGQQVGVMLLKGYGLSLNYPVPEHRPCGDIDVFTFGYAEFVNQLAERLLKVKVDRGNPHHSVFSYGGFTFENHISLLDVERHRNHISDEEIFQNLIDEGCEEIEIEGQKCFVPSVKLNSVYLLRHMAHHFAVEKITLRHILDWALFAKTHSSEIDWRFVFDYAQKTDCDKFLNCLNGVCVESLGFAAEDFPARTHDVKLQNRMLSDNLKPEFGADIPDMNHKLKYGIFKTRRILANRWKYRMVSDECLLTTIWNLAKKRI